MRFSTLFLDSLYEFTRRHHHHHPNFCNRSLLLGLCVLFCDVSIVMCNIVWSILSYATYTDWVVVDMMLLTMNIFGVCRLNLFRYRTSTVCGYFGLPITPSTSHSAIEREYASDDLCVCVTVVEHANHLYANEIDFLKIKQQQQQPACSNSSCSCGTTAPPKYCKHSLKLNVEMRRFVHSPAPT